MDIETREHFWNLIEQLKEDGITILYTSHYIEEVERMADKVVYLEQKVSKLMIHHIISYLVKIIQLLK